MEILNKDIDQKVSDKFINVPSFQFSNDNVFHSLDAQLLDELMELIYTPTYEQTARDLYRATAMELYYNTN